MRGFGLKKNLSSCGTIHILAAGTCWGFIGLFVKNIYRLGLTPYETVFYRMFLGAVFLGIVILAKPSAGFRISSKALFKTMAIGLVSQMFFNYFYFRSIEVNPLSLAVILMYTAPVFAAVTARFVYGELLTPGKIMALFFCLVGCFLTVTGGRPVMGDLDLSGILFGLLSGFCYAMFPIISKSIPQGNNPYTLTFYSMLFGSIFFLPVAYFNDAMIFTVSSGKIFYLALLVTVSTALPYIFYYTGMGKGIEASKAGVVSTIEVAVAVVVSVVFFRETVDLIQLIGILMVFVSIFMLNAKKIHLPVIGQKQIKK
ncbi:MAG: hypothetical protein C0604_01135 [Clostridiales bacterium]|nr:MAG: hypothetical protein C0604_01135 [Clostridiales bacterium]